MGKVRPQSSGFGGGKCTHCGSDIPHDQCWDNQGTMTVKAVTTPMGVVSVKVKNNNVR